MKRCYTSLPLLGTMQGTTSLLLPAYPGYNINPHSFSLSHIPGLTTPTRRLFEEPTYLGQTGQHASLCTFNTQHTGGRHPLCAEGSTHTGKRAPSLRRGFSHNGERYPLCAEVSLITRVYASLCVYPGYTYQHASLCVSRVHLPACLPVCI